MLSIHDHGMCQSTQDYAMDAEELDLNGKCLVLWFPTDVYVFDQQPSGDIAILEGVNQDDRRWNPLFCGD